MKSFDKNFTKTTIITFFIIFLFVVIQNFVSDPFSVFVEPEYAAIDAKKFFPNERYLKVKYLLANKDKYDSFLIGSCISNYMNLDGIKGQKWYNLTFTRGMIVEMWRYLSLLVENGVKIDRVLIQISEDVLKFDDNDYKNISKDYINYTPFPITTSEKAVFYAKYLVYFPFINSTKYEPWYEGSKRNIFNGGSFLDRLPISESEMFKTKNELFEQDKIHFDSRDYNYKNVEYLKKMHDLCVKKNIEFEVFFIPKYISLYEKVDFSKYHNIKEKIVEITPYWDFTGINKISTDKKYWTDPIHINNWTSKLIVDRIFTQNRQSVPEINDFGVFISKSNFDKHEAKLLEDLEQYRKSKH